MSDCRFGVSPVNYPDPDPDPGLKTNHAINFISTGCPQKTWTFLENVAVSLIFRLCQ